MACLEKDSNWPFNICPCCHFKEVVLGMTITVTMMVTKVAI